MYIYNAPGNFMNLHRGLRHFPVSVLLYLQSLQVIMNRFDPATQQACMGFGLVLPIFFC